MPGQNFPIQHPEIKCLSLLHPRRPQLWPPLYPGTRLMHSNYARISRPTINPFFGIVHTLFHLLAPSPSSKYNGRSVAGG
jgi:hypothetical protein